MHFSNNTVVHARSFLPIAPTKMLTILLNLLVALPLSHSDPICQDPPPDSTYIPALSDCQNLVNDIFAISNMQHDEPILWSEHPPLTYRSRKLPYSFKDPLNTNDCEFVVAPFDQSDFDIFSTRLVAETASDLVERCMEQGIDGAETLGADAVGPKGVIAVVMLRRIMKGEWTNGALDQLNVTKVRLSKPGVVSGLLSSRGEAS